MLSKLKNNHSFKRYFFNTGWLLFERALRILITLFVGVYVARYLGPKQFGLLSYAMAFVGIFSAIAELGLDGIVIRELVKNPEKRYELLGTSFFLKLVGAVCMWGAIAIGLQFAHNDGFINLLIVIISAGVLFRAFNVVDFNFQATVQARYVVHAQIVQMIVSSIAKLTLIWFEAPLVLFAIVVPLDAFILAMGLLWNYLRKVGHLSAWKLKTQTAINLLKNSWPLILSSLAITIYMRIDQVMIKMMLGSKEVGYYAAAVSLSRAWYFIPIAITSSLFPAIISIRKRSKKLYYSHLQRLYNLMVWIASTIALPVTFLAPWIIKTLYGNAYLPAASVLSIHVWSGVFIFLRIASEKWILSENLIYFEIIKTSIGAILNIILNLFLINKYGINGAAISTFISISISGYFIYIISSKTRITFFMMTKSLLFGIKNERNI